MKFEDLKEKALKVFDKYSVGSIIDLEEFAKQSEINTVLEKQLILKEIVDSKLGVLILKVHCKTCNENSLKNFYKTPKTSKTYYCKKCGKNIKINHENLKMFIKKIS